jgi:REP element-mobilizing transposase RayT
MELPKSVRVGHRDYAVVPWDRADAEDKEALGDCDHIHGVIRVRADLSAQESVRVLIHEVFHAMWHVGDLEKSAREEKAVSVLSFQWAAVLGQNPGLVAFMSDALSS